MVIINSLQDEVSSLALFGHLSDGAKILVESFTFMGFSMYAVKVILLLITLLGRLSMSQVILVSIEDVLSHLHIFWDYF